MLWIFNKTFPKLTYCPMLVPVIALKLLFLTEYETYVTCRKMLEESTEYLDEKKQYDSQKMRGLRWHFTFAQEDFYKSIDAFYTYIKGRKNWKKIEDHFKSINFDFAELFKEWFASLFLGFYPLKIVLQIFFAYLNEGIKIYYRYAYATLKTFKKQIF
mmetsp:Transcript_26338/g.23226  ORF Transcript_26338/g.23226 Transcript_26338/m.23226 type:complete len:158 (+) Transcript_26338:619-1092(+)